MPLPDANKKSPRVYTNLQNLDLDNVTFANVQATGNPIAVEEMNEDEMRRLVLVNLARLVCAGEWTGLLEAGGGGTGSLSNAQFTAYDWDGDEDPVRIMALPPYGTIERGATTSGGANNNLIWHPFIAPESGTISEVDLYVDGASGASGAVDIGFYSDVDGLPKTFLGEFVVPTTSTGVITQTTSSEDVVTERGVQYWVGFFMDNLDSGPTFIVTERGTSGSSTLCTGANALWIPAEAIAEADASGTGNHTITDYTALAPSNYDPINIGVKW